MIHFQEPQELIVILTNSHHCSLSWGL